MSTWKGRNFGNSFLPIPEHAQSGECSINIFLTKMFRKLSEIQKEHNGSASDKVYVFILKTQGLLCARHYYKYFAKSSMR